jgi:hypothetical protein
MAVELKEGWNGPFTLTVKAAGPKGIKQDGSGTQWKGEHPPHKDLLQWETIFEETGGARITVASDEPPLPGTCYTDAWVKVKANEKSPQYPFRTMYTTEDKAKLGQGVGRPGGGGFKPVYTTEQQATKDAYELAIAAVMGGFEGKDGVMPKNLKSIDTVAAHLYSKIMGAKSQQPTETPQQ